MSALLRSELFKLSTTRSCRLLTVAAVAVSMIGSTLTLALGTVTSERDVSEVLSWGGASGIVVLVMAVVESAGEWRHGTILPTVLATPARHRVLAAKALALMLVGAVIGLGCVALTAATTLAWLGGRHALPPADTMLMGLTGGVLYCALSGAFGVAVGVLTRNQVGGVAALGLVIAVIDPMLAALLPDAGQFGLTALGLALSGATADTTGPSQALLPIRAAALAYLSYAVLLIISAAVLLARRDVRA